MLCRLGRFSWVDALPPLFGSGGCLTAMVLLVIALCSGRMLRRPGCGRWVDALPPFYVEVDVVPLVAWADALLPFFSSADALPPLLLLWQMFCGHSHDVAGCFATTLPWRWYPCCRFGY